MTLTLSPPNFLRPSSSQGSSSSRKNSTASASGNPTVQSDEIELSTGRHYTWRRNTDEESARAKENAQKFMQRHMWAKPFSAPHELERIIADGQPKHLKEFTLPISFNPNTATHEYLQSSNPEFHRVLEVLNKRIQRQPELLEDLGEHPIDFTMELFSQPNPHLDNRFHSLQDTYGNGLLVRTDQALQYGVDGFQDGRTRKGYTWLGKYTSEAAHNNKPTAININDSAAYKLSSLLGDGHRDEFSFPISKNLQTLLQPHVQSNKNQLTLSAELQRFAEQHLNRSSDQIDYSSPEVQKFLKKHIRITQDQISYVSPELQDYLQTHHGFAEAPTVYAKPGLQNLLRQHLGFFENQVTDTAGTLYTDASGKVFKDKAGKAAKPANLENYIAHNFPGSQISHDHPDDQKLMRNWRLKTGARYVENRASHIVPTWGDWWASVKTSTIYSFVTDGMLGNVFNSFGPGAIFKNSDFQKAGIKKDPWYHRLFLGVSDSDTKKLWKSAPLGQRVWQKFAAVFNGAWPQAGAEVPDVAFVKSAQAKVENPRLTRAQAMAKTLNEEKGGIAKSVVSAFFGTMPEKAKELLWLPTSMGGKVGNWITGYFTNAVSVLSCAFPFFEDGGPQRKELGFSNAEAFHPETGDLKLMPRQQAALDKSIKASKNEWQGVKHFFQGGAWTDTVHNGKNLLKRIPLVGRLFKAGNVGEEAMSKYLHKLPLAKILGASIPVAIFYSLFPSTINGAVKTFMKEGLASDIIQKVIGMLQVPLFGPIELLSFNTVAVMNARWPRFVDELSKMGRPVIDGVQFVASGIKSGFTSTWRFVRRSPKPEDINQPYKDWAETYAGKRAV